MPHAKLRLIKSVIEGAIKICKLTLYPHGLKPVQSMSVTATYNKAVVKPT